MVVVGSVYKGGNRLAAFSGLCRGHCSRRIPPCLHVNSVQVALAGLGIVAWKIVAFDVYLTGSGRDIG